MIWIPRPRQWAGRTGPPHTVVGDIEAQGMGFGPEGHVDGVLVGRCGVVVLDAVARRLIHGEDNVVFGVPGQSERRQPAAHLGA